MAFLPRQPDAGRIGHSGTTVQKPFQALVAQSTSRSNGSTSPCAGGYRSRNSATPPKRSYFPVNVPFGDRRRDSVLGDRIFGAKPGPELTSVARRPPQRVRRHRPCADGCTKSHLLWRLRTLGVRDGANGSPSLPRARAATLARSCETNPTWAFRCSRRGGGRAAGARESALVLATRCTYPQG